MSKVNHRKRIWYHCAAHYRGHEWTARRRCPRVIGTSEPDTPRLCVCPTIAACFAARLFAHQGDVYVYRTIKPRSANRPVDVHDAVLTGERWIVPPCRMAWHSVIPAAVVDRIVWPQVRRLTGCESAGKPEPLSGLERMELYARSLPILHAAGVDVPHWEVRFVRSALRLLQTSGDQAA